MSIINKWMIKSLMKSLNNVQLNTIAAVECYDKNLENLVVLILQNDIFVTSPVIMLAQ